MSYPTPPGRRIPYDENGTRVLISSSVGDDRTPYQVHSRAVAALNSDVGHGMILDDDWWSFADNRDGYYSKNFLALIFPHPMDITGAAVSLQADFKVPSGGGFPVSFGAFFAKLTARVQVSTDTTNGLDGTWTNIFTKDENDTHLGYTMSFYNTGSPQSAPDKYPEPPVFPDGTLPSPGGVSRINSGIGSLVIPLWNIADTQDFYELDGPRGRGIQAVSGASNVMGVRLYFPRRPAPLDAAWPASSTLYGAAFLLHLYGDTGSAASDDRLQIRNAADTDSPDLKWGDVTQGVPETRTIKVKNFSSTEDAEAVTLRIIPTYSDPGTAPEQLALSLDGDIWASRVLLGDIPAGSVSDDVLLRLNPTTDTIGLRSAYVVAQAGGWN